MFDPGVKLLNTVPGSDFNKLSDTSNPPTLSSLDCWLLVVNCLFAWRPGYGSCLTNTSKQLYKLHPKFSIRRRIIFQPKLKINQIYWTFIWTTDRTFLCDCGPICPLSSGPSLYLKLYQKYQRTVIMVTFSRSFFYCCINLKSSQATGYFVVNWYSKNKIKFPMRCSVPI